MFFHKLVTMTLVCNYWFFFIHSLCQHCPQRISRSKAVFLCLFWEQIGQIFIFFKVSGHIHWFIQLNMIAYDSTVTESNVFRILIKILLRRIGWSTFNVLMSSIITLFSNLNEGWLLLIIYVFFLENLLLLLFKGVT